MFTLKDASFLCNTRFQMSFCFKNFSKSNNIVLFFFVEQSKINQKSIVQPILLELKAQINIYSTNVYWCVSCLYFILCACESVWWSKS